MTHSKHLLYVVVIVFTTTGSLPVASPPLLNFELGESTGEGFFDKNSVILYSLVLICIR